MTRRRCRDPRSHRGDRSSTARLVGTVGARRPGWRGSLVRLDEVESLFASGDLIVDACRRTVRDRMAVCALPDVRSCSLWSRRLQRPGRPTFRAITSSSAFSRHALPTSRTGARLRVEVSRVRAELRRLVRIEATRRGFVLAPINASAVIVLAPPIDGAEGSILALLEGGESWSTSALAHALGSSQRTVQRALRQLRKRRRCVLSGTVAPAAGSRRRSADSRQPCYSRGAANGDSLRS
jgi:hypothetical protein